MRLAGAEKIGYYPTPTRTLQQVANLLTVNNASTIRLLDPCAGAGEALAFVQQQLQATSQATVLSYGVEIADPRAELATGVLDHVLHGDWQDSALSHEGFGLLWLNPPYDTTIEEGKQRQEYLFLKGLLTRLQVGGVLVYIVPIGLLNQATVCKFLAAHFHSLTVRRLCDEEFSQFKQIVITGIRKERADPDPAMADYLNTFGLDNLPDLLENNQTRYAIPAIDIPAAKLIFRKITLAYEDVLRQVPAQGAYHHRQFKDWTTAHHDFAFRPVVPLKTGHVGSLISSGQMGVINLQTVAAKGRATKVIEFFDAQGHKVERDDASMAESRERFTTEVTTIDQAGAHASITSVADMQAFLEDYAGQIASAISARYQPLYTKATDAEWQQLGKLMRQKKLPGRKTGGLLPAQKHAAAACVRSLKAQGWVDLIGEMGTGKTCTSLTALDLANAYPAIIMCPGHMVEKWAREAREVVPGVQATIITNLADLNQFVTKAKTGGKHIAVLSKERAKLGSGWAPAVLWRLRRVGIKHDATGMPTATAICKVPACPSCGTLLTDKEGLPLLTMPANKRLFCDHCQAPLYKYCGLRRWPLTDYIKRQLKNFFKCFIADEFHQYKGKSTDQAESYHHLVLASQYTINLTGTLFGGKSTDLFWLRYRVDPDVRRTYGFSDEQLWAQHYGRIERTFNRPKENNNDFGKFSGKERYVINTKEIPGISPAIFARLLKSCIFVRITDLGYGLPSYHEEITRLFMAPAQAQQYEWMNNLLYSKILAGMGWNVSAKERHEAKVMLSTWLQSCLSRPNATFRREPVLWSPNRDGARVPFHISEHNYSQIEEAGLDPDLVSNEHGELPMVLYPLTGLQPKEEELISVAKAEIAAGRKVILGVRQTGTRNIQPHLQKLLADAGLRAVTLPDTLAPAKREAWIDAQVHNIDVLITNPKKVETGLDLIKFHTIIVYETEYSLYTLWQFMRRVWRLGQQKPVKVIFMVYQGTLESAALSLIGEKMKAALLLYGDNAASAITAESDAGGSLLDELASRILAGETLSSDGITGLLKQSMPEVEFVEEEAVEPVAEPAILASTPAAKPLTTLRPLKSQTQPKPQLSFLDLEIEEEGEDTGAQKQLPYSWGEFILAVVAKPVGRELKQMHAGQQSFADLLL